jgi:hypothetical protein
LNGALSAELEPFVLHKLVPSYLANAEVMERVLAQPRIALETVAEAASHCSEHVAELIAVNEERMLAHPPIIERLYMNKATRMSTADRIIEIAVRNKLERTGIPAYKEVAIAIGQELIEEAQWLGTQLELIGDAPPPMMREETRYLTPGAEPLSEQEMVDGQVLTALRQDRKNDDRRGFARRCWAQRPIALISCATATACHLGRHRSCSSRSPKSCA